MKIGILGYGNLGRGVEFAVKENSDMELAAVFTRRNPDSVKILSENVPVVHVDDVKNWTGKIDVMILCGGSATDLPEQTPKFAEMFNVIDSFDTHAKIPEHFAKVNEAAKSSSHVAISILPDGKDYTFWGKGVSQGHSDAVRRIAGVKNAKQYTIPIEKALEEVRSGKNPELTTRQKHLRECFVVLEEGADAEKIEQEIKTMPNYFSDYDTTVNFISEEEFLKNHSGLAHGGFVIRSGNTGENKIHNHVAEFNLKLDSNPEFTASVLVAYARAAFKLCGERNFGCKTVLDIPPVYLSKEPADVLRAKLL